MTDSRGMVSSATFSGPTMTPRILSLSRRLISEPCNAWRSAVEDRLEELIRLEQGWDGYAASPVAFVTAVFALNMLESVCNDRTPAPQIVPGTNGDLQLEWHTFNGDLELDVRAPNDVIAWRSTLHNPDGIELKLRNDFQAVAQWVREITEPQFAALAAAA